MEPSLRTNLDQHIIMAKAIIYRTISGGLCEVMPHWVRGFSGLQMPVFNAFSPLDPLGLNDETLADTAAFFGSRNVHYMIELIHDVIPEGPDYLNKRHYQSLPPQMAMVLNGPPLEVQVNREVMVERVTTVPSLTAFCTTLHAVFDFPLRDLISYFPARHFEDERIQHYLAFLDEQPVGAGTIISVDGVSSIRNVCTIDSYRRRGVATALVNRMLLDANSGNSPHTMLYSTAHAFQLFSSFGFEIYTQRQWFLPPGIDYEE